MQNFCVARDTGLKTAVGLAAIAFVFGCAAVPTPGQMQAPGSSVNRESDLPAGFGSLRQDDIALRFALAAGLQVRVMPLDESFIRLLSPDSYKAMSDLVTSKQADLDRMHNRMRLPAYSLWMVNFFAQEQGETRFSPMEIVIRNTGRDFRPIEVISLTPGFGEYRLRQRETQSALYVFDGDIDPNQPLSIFVESVEGTGWQSVIQRIERERVLVRSRSSSSQQIRDTTGV